MNTYCNVWRQICWLSQLSVAASRRSAAASLAEQTGLWLVGYVRHTNSEKWCTAEATAALLRSFTQTTYKNILIPTNF